MTLDEIQAKKTELEKRWFDELTELLAMAGDRVSFDGINVHSQEMRTFGGKTLYIPLYLKINLEI